MLVATIARTTFLIPLMPTIFPYFCFKLQRKALSIQLEPDFSLPFLTDIWEIRQAGDRLLITTRDSQALEVSFALFEISKQEFLWQNLAFEESWWISAYQFTGDFVVFQTYNDTQDIEARTAFAFDVEQEEALWSIEQVKLQMVNDKVLRYTSEEGDAALIEIATGQLVEELIPSEQDEAAAFPLTYEAESKHATTLNKFLQKKCEVELVGGIDYLEHNELILISGNFKEEDTYSLHLFVFDVEGNLLLHEIMENDLNGLASGTFFIVNQALIFVKEKREIIFYQLK